jgi:hypothetical protein
MAGTAVRQSTTSQPHLHLSPICRSRLGTAALHKDNSTVCIIDSAPFVLEGVRQIRGTSANQVPDAKHVLCSAGQSAVLLGNG